MAARSALLMVGSGMGDPPLIDLERDVRDLASVLGDPDIGGYDVHLLADPHTEEARTALERFITSAGTGDELLFYFNGDAAKDEEGNLWFLTRDSESSGSPFDGLPADPLRWGLEGSDVGSLVVILDCSYGGAIFEQSGLPLTKGIPAISILTSSSTNEQSMAGGFIPLIIRGLQDGSADTDRDGLVSFDDLCEYVVRRMREAGAQQQPSRYESTPTRDLYLAKNPAGAAPSGISGNPDAPQPPVSEATSEDLSAGHAAAHPEFSDDLAGDLSADLVKPDEGIPADRDHLGVSTYVGMFASVIAYQKTPLPLSIGLFGEWGSGKSYFMGLLRDRVKTLANRRTPITTRTSCRSASTPGATRTATSGRVLATRSSGSLQGRVRVRPTITSVPTPSRTPPSQRRPLLARQPPGRRSLAAQQPGPRRGHRRSS